MLADYYNLDENKAYTIAAYHDIELSVNRDNHEKESGGIFIKDPELKKYFSDVEIEEMKQAIEDHRGSRKAPPRNMYAKFFQIQIEILILKYYLKDN